MIKIVYIYYKETKDKKLKLKLKFRGVIFIWQIKKIGIEVIVLYIHGEIVKVKKNIMQHN